MAKAAVMLEKFNTKTEDAIREYEETEDEYENEEYYDGICNAELEEAMRECEEMLATGNYVSYKSAEELHAAILAEGDDDD